MRISKLTTESEKINFKHLGSGTCSKGKFNIMKSSHGLVFKIDGLDGLYSVSVVSIIETIIKTIVKTNPEEDKK